jgi:hypothetical protein
MNFPLAEQWIKDTLARCDGRVVEANVEPTIQPSFVIGPSVFRAPPEQVRAPPPMLTPPPMGDRLGELVDMVWVNADDAKDAIAEVRLQFKADAWGGVRMSLRREAAGLVARILVDDAAQRRHMEPHAEALKAHLIERGMKVVDVMVVVA